MAPKQRPVRIEQRGGLEAIQALEQRTDEELENETKYKSAALAILGARASERFDADAWAILRWWQPMPEETRRDRCRPSQLPPRPVSPLPRPRRESPLPLPRQSHLSA